MKIEEQSGNFWLLFLIVISVVLAHINYEKKTRIRNNNA